MSPTTPEVQLVHPAPHERTSDDLPILPSTLPEAQKQQLQRLTDEKIMQQLKAEIDAIRQENAVLKQPIEKSARMAPEQENGESVDKPK
jgi:hypothetical protein